MELVTAYLYNRLPIPIHNIHSMTFNNLKRHQWYSDIRASRKFQLFNKRFQIQGQWYRVIVRFQYDKEKDLYELNLPVPFVITECSTNDGITFVDHKVYHGREVKNTVGYIKEGIPSELIDRVIDDLNENIIYEKDQIHLYA